MPGAPAQLDIRTESVLECRWAADKSRTRLPGSHNHTHILLWGIIPGATPCFRYGRESNTSVEQPMLVAAVENCLFLDSGCSIRYHPYIIGDKYCTQANHVVEDDSWSHSIASRFASSFGGGIGIACNAFA